MTGWNDNIPDDNFDYDAEIQRAFDFPVEDDAADDCDCPACAIRRDMERAEDES